MPVLKTLVDAEEKMRFQSAAKARGLSESELLRALALAVDQECEVFDRQPIKPDLDKLEQEQMTVRMPRFLIDGVKQRAKYKGMASSRWVVALIQSNLLFDPVMTNDELAALLASNRELAAVGRNVNQIAKAINEAFYETERVRLDKLDDLKHIIKKNMNEIRKLVRASKNSWSEG